MTLSQSASANIWIELKVYEYCRQQGIIFRCYATIYIVKEYI